MGRVVVIRGLAMLGLLGLAAPGVAQDEIAPVFRDIQAADMASAKVWLPEIWPKSDLALIGHGEFTARHSTGVKPKRTEKTCALGPEQIAMAIDALKQAKPRDDDRDGLGAIISMTFETQGGRRIVAVVSSPEKGMRGSTLIFFDGKLALLRRADLARVKRAAADAGCKP